MDEDDNELTSLNWLHNVSILGTTIVPAVTQGPMTTLAMRATAAATQDQKDFQTIRIGINQDDHLSSCSKKGKKKSKKSSSRKVS